MKNFKKLFIALPLVLVMLFAALPVFAEVNTYKIKAETLAVDLQIGSPLDNQYLTAKTRQVPVWAAETTTYAEGKGKLFSYGAGWIKLLNDGYPAAWVEANEDAVAPLQIAQYAVQNKPFFVDNGYVLPTYNINHVERVFTDITVPETWTGKELDAAYYVKGNQHPLVKAGETLAADDLGDIKVNNGVATYNTQSVKVDVTAVENPEALVTAKLTGSKTNEGKFVVALTDKDGAAVTKSGKDNKIENNEEYALADLENAGFKMVAIDTEAKTATYTYQPQQLSYKFAADVYEFADKEVLPNVTQYFTKDGKTYVTVNDKDVEVVVGKAAEKFVEAKLEGLLVIVDKANVPVTVKHHYMVADGEEIVKETKEVQDKNVVLTPNNILQSWLMPVGSYVYDPAQTKVEAVKEDKTMINGEVFVTGYVVDLFYTAAEGEESDIEAAFANTTAGVANQQNVANLPATGAASNVAVILSSVALVVVGLFLKK